MNDPNPPSLSRRHMLAALAGGLLLPVATGCRSAQAARCKATSEDLRGPYWTRGDPSVVDLVKGGPLRIQGLVRGTDCRPIPGARINLWQADPAGFYDDKKLRGVLRTAKDGSYGFDTLKPGNYREPGGWRPAHIHFDVSAPGYRSVVGQLYFAGDRYLGPNDSCGVCRSSDADRIIELKPVKGRRSHQAGEFFITLAQSQ